VSTDTVWRQPWIVCIRRITTVSRPPYITTRQGLFPRRLPHPNPLILRPPFWTPSFIFASCCGFADGQPAVCELQHYALAPFFPPLTLLLSVYSHENPVSQINKGDKITYVHNYWLLILLRFPHKITTHYYGEQIPSWEVDGFLVPMSCFCGT